MTDATRAVAWQSRTQVAVASRNTRSITHTRPQVPSPVALVVGGSWKGHLAGGRLPQPTWPSNPQFMVAAQQRAEVMVTLMRTDAMAANAVDGPQDAHAAVGLAAVEVQFCPPHGCSSAHPTAAMQPAMLYLSSTCVGCAANVAHTHLCSDVHSCGDGV